MKKVLYITVFLLFVTACSNNKSAKEVPTYQTAPKLEEVKKMSDSLEVKPNFKYTGGGTVFKNDKLAAQKIQQIIDIALLLKQDSTAVELKKNALSLAMLLYKNKDIAAVEEELARFDLPQCDSIIIKSVTLKGVDKVNGFVKGTTYYFDLNIYRKGTIASIQKKKAVLVFENIKTQLEGKEYFSIQSKILAIE